MPRNYANVLTAIWRDPDFTALPSAAQRCLLLLVTQPDVTAAGTLAMTVRRWAKLAPDTTENDVYEALAELHDRGFVMVDEDTEEVLVVPFIRWDGGYTNPKRKPVITESALGTVSHALGWALAQQFKALDLPLAGLPDAPPDSPSLDPLPPQEGLCDSHPDSHCDPSCPAERVAVVTEVDVASNPQPATRNPQPVSSTHTLDPDRFDEFYAVYPRHVGRGAARKAYAGARRRKVAQQHIIDAAKRFAQKCECERTEVNFIPHPATWLNQERYDDQPDPEPTLPAHWQAVSGA